MDLELIPSLEPAYEKLKKAARNEMVFVTGPPSTGKTTLVKTLFEDYKEEYLHAYIDCYAVATQAKLLSLVCQAFHSALNVRRSRADKTGVRLPESGEPVSMNDFPRFVGEYHKIATEKGYRRVFIVLDSVEVFERTNLMDTFVALCRFNALGLRLIVISYEDPADLVHYVAQKSPSIAMSVQDRLQVVSCDVWSKEDTVNWILKSPPKREVEIYSKFVKNIVVLVHAAESKDPRQIRMYCQSHFEDFVDYYREKRREYIVRLDSQACSMTDEELEEYQIGGSHNAALVANFLQTFKVMISKDRDNSKWTHEDTETRMPTNTALLIVAAYIAAYTKTSDDKINFIRYQRSKKAPLRHSTDNMNRPFTMERLIQIFLKVMQSAIGSQHLHIIYNNDGVLADIERLENLNILQHQSGYDLSSDARYKLSHSIKKNYVQRLAKNHQLSLAFFHGLNQSAADDI